VLLASFYDKFIRTDIVVGFCIQAKICDSRRLCIVITRNSLKLSFKNIGTFNEIRKPHNENLPLTLTLLMWKKWLAHNNASRWQVGFNSAFKGLIFFFIH